MIATRRDKEFMNPIPTVEVANLLARYCRSHSRIRTLFTS